MERDECESRQAKSGNRAGWGTFAFLVVATHTCVERGREGRQCWLGIGVRSGRNCPLFTLFGPITLFTKNWDSTNSSTGLSVLSEDPGAYSFLRNAPAKQSLDKLHS